MDLYTGEKIQELHLRRVAHVKDVEKMASNDKPVEEGQVLEPSWDLTAQEPIEPQEKFQYRFTRKRESQYYKSIDWPKWWDEFNGARKKDGYNAGKKLYETINSFIQAKTKVHWQQQLLQDMIGPQPKSNGELRKVPYLGNWEKIRRNGFYVFDDPEKARAVQIALEQKRELINATRQLAPNIGKRMAYWYRIKDIITESLVGKLMEDEEVEVIENKKTKKTKTGKKVIDSFLKWQFKVESMIAQLEEQFMKVHGVDPQDPGSCITNQIALATQAGAAAALTGVAATMNGQIPGRPVLIQDGRELPLPDDVSYDAILLAQHLKQHAETFNLPLPEDQQFTGKKNGKSKAQ